MDGDEVRIVYEAHSDALTRFAAFLVGPSDAPDVLAAALLRVLESSSSQPVANKPAFLYTAVLNEARMLHRGNARRRVREKRFHAPQVVLQPELHPEVRSAVDRLSTRQRAVIVMTYWDDLSPSAIGELLGMSDGTVRRHLARARAHLRRQLDA